MATRSKRIKLMAASQPDPFTAILFDLHDLVIQHFKVEDIKQLTKVSKRWNQIIGGSSAAMKRIRLRLRGWEFLSRNRQELARTKLIALLKSDRSYQNMDLYLPNETNKKRMVMLLPKFSSSLVELDLSGDDIQMKKYLPAILSFPKLEALCASWISVCIATKFFKDANKLRRLSVSVKNPSEINEEFVKMMYSKKTLKELDLGNFFENLFSLDSLQKPEFQLTSLTVRHHFDPVNPVPGILHNYNAFVFAMADTLTSLEIVFFQAEHALLIPNLPSLKALKIGWHLEDSLASYEPNTSIEVFEFAHINTARPAFLKSLKSVRTISTKYIDKDCFKVIVKNCPPLTMLKARIVLSVMRQDFEDIFKEVRSVEPSSVESIEVSSEIDRHLL
jgi:hypothetical protein